MPAGEMQNVHWDKAWENGRASACMPQQRLLCVRPPTPVMPAQGQPWTHMHTRCARGTRQTLACPILANCGTSCNPLTDPAL